MYVHEDKDLDNDLRMNALTLALGSEKYDFCGTYFGLKIAAGYLHHRNGLPPERFPEVIPVTHDVVPEECHRDINAAYVIQGKIKSELEIIRNITGALNEDSIDKL